MEEVNIPEDLNKFYYEGMNGEQKVIIMVKVNNEKAVVVDEGFNPIEKPSVLPPEADDFLSNLRLELVNPENCPDYKLNL